MALISLWSSNPDAVLSWSIEQVVSAGGDGKLRDDSECSKEVRAFLSQVPSEKLGAYSEHCLVSGFNKSGMVLQDIVNELGRRLDYVVTNGRYQGSSNSIGNDGLWRSPEGLDILVEVKTTDAYRVSLETIATYREKLRTGGTIGGTNSMLIIVGREDTGELEAQVRGSRYAWDMRLISVESLVRLVKLKENTEGQSTGTKIRSLLVPMEYTRLDNLIDVVFTTARDVEVTADVKALTVSEDEESKTTFDFTDSELLQNKRNQIIDTFAKKHSTKLIRKSPAQYWSADHQLRAACAVSKRYSRQSGRYWYAYHPQWDEFLGNSDTAYLVLGCMDLESAFAIPVRVLRQHLVELNTTTRADGTTYWHIKIVEPQTGKYALLLSKSGKQLSLSPFSFVVGVSAANPGPGKRDK